MRRPIQWIILALAGLLLAGCADRGMQDLRQYVDEVKSRKAGRIEPLPEIKQVETFTYVAGGRRNPFIPLAQEQDDAVAAKVNGIAPDPNRRKEELENYPLDSLRMVGTLNQEEITWALIRTQENTIYRVRTGNYLGRNNGQITLVGESAVELTEIVPDGQGGYQERQASLALTE